METSEVISTDQAKCVRLKVTQENVIIVDGQEARWQKPNTVFEGFLKLRPKAWGTVQVMNGVMTFFLGILLTINNYNYHAILECSGITYWGSLIYISAGCLSIAAQNELKPCVMNASFGMNVFSAIAAGLTIVLTAIQLGFIMMMDPSLYVEYLNLRIIGIMMVFIIPQFFISICISAFFCKVTTNRDSIMVNVLYS